MYFHGNDYLTVPNGQDSEQLTGAVTLYIDIKHCILVTTMRGAKQLVHRDLTILTRLEFNYMKHLPRLLDPSTINTQEKRFL